MNEIYDRKDVAGNVIGRGVRTICPEPSLTKQAMQQECDINYIMKRFEKTQTITHLSKRQAYFADVSEVPDFAAAVDIVRKADEMFSSLPAQIRKEFDNDAARYVQFCSDPANLERMRELGIADPLPVQEVVQVQVMNPPAEGGAA